MHDHKLARMLRFGIRLSAIVTIFLCGVSNSEHLAAFECETGFMFCVDAGECNEGVGCTYGGPECEGTVDCMSGPGCPEQGEVAMICEMNPE